MAGGPGDAVAGAAADGAAPCVPCVLERGRPATGLAAMLFLRTGPLGLAVAVVAVAVVVVVARGAPALAAVLRAVALLRALRGVVVVVGVMVVRLVIERRPFVVVVVVRGTAAADWRRSAVAEAVDTAEAAIEARRLASVCGELVWVMERRAAALTALPGSCDGFCWASPVRSDRGDVVPLLSCNQKQKKR